MQQVQDAHADLGNRPRERKTRGRKDGQKQEKVINLKELAEAMPELLRAKKKAKDTSDDYGTMVKKVAEKAGLNAGAVRKYVNARAGDNFDEKKKECEQLSLMFDEVARGEK